MRRDDDEQLNDTTRVPVLFLLLWSVILPECVFRLCVLLPVWVFVSLPAWVGFCLYSNMNRYLSMFLRG